jgi:WD40 repeat protein
VPGDPARFLSGAEDGTVRQWALSSANPERQFAHGGPVSCIAVRPDGKAIASAGGRSRSCSTSPAAANWRR